MYDALRAIYFVAYVTRRSLKYMAIRFQQRWCARLEENGLSLENIVAGAHRVSNIGIIALTWIKRLKRVPINVATRKFLQKISLSSTLTRCNNDSNSFRSTLSTHSTSLTIRAEPNSYETIVWKVKRKTKFHCHLFLFFFRVIRNVSRDREVCV